MTGGGPESTAGTGEDPSGWSSRLDNPVLVQWEYASEERLRARNAIYRDLLEGANPEQMILDALAEISPERVLDVGCGTGEIGQRIADELGVEVIAVDTSPRMIELARERGLDARLGDVQELPFADGEFDCAVAAWLIYHVAGPRRRDPGARARAPARRPTRRGDDGRGQPRRGVGADRRAVGAGDQLRPRERRRPARRRTSPASSGGTPTGRSSSRTPTRFAR